jgi:hypothetical protein
MLMLLLFHRHPNLLYRLLIYHGVDFVWIKAKLSLVSRSH